MKRRAWRKCHLAVDRQRQMIEGFELTDEGVQDCQGVPGFLSGMASPIATLMGDGAYDRFSAYAHAEHHVFQLVTPP